MSLFNIYLLGDVVGSSGRRAVQKFLKNKEPKDIVIVNAENAAGGFGVTEKIYKDLLKRGVDVITSGNHVWDKKQVKDQPELFPKLAVPYNLPQANKDVAVVSLSKFGVDITVINLSGRVFMPIGADDPFQAFDELYDTYKGTMILVDFHAEATSEKVALAYYADGRAAAVVGTHTHVQTSDNRILPKGTFAITDLGSCAAVNSILGMTVESSLYRFLEGNGRLAVEKGGVIAVTGVKLIVDQVGDEYKVVDHKLINITY